MTAASGLRHCDLNHHHHSRLVGDVAVPVSARQVVLSCAFLNPDARPRLNGRRSASTVLSQVYVSDDLDAASSSWECAICMFGEHGSDPGTCPPVTLMTFNKQSNARRAAVESKPTLTQSRIADLCKPAQNNGRRVYAATSEYIPDRARS